MTGTYEGGDPYANTTLNDFNRIGTLLADEEQALTNLIQVNIENFLRKGGQEPLPVLEPGDVISVPRNNLSRWKTTASIIRDLSIVATTYFLYLRTTR